MDQTELKRSVCANRGIATSIAITNPWCRPSLREGLPLFEVPQEFPPLPSTAIEPPFETSLPSTSFP